MATYYHYTDADSLVKIVREKLLLSSEGSGLSAAASESVFFTKKVNFCMHIGSELPKVLFKVPFWALLLAKALKIALFKSKSTKNSTF